MALAEQAINTLRQQEAAREARKQAFDGMLASVKEVYDRHGFRGPVQNPHTSQPLLFVEQENLVRVERALAILESSNTVERMSALEARIAETRVKNEEAAVKFSIAERAVESARQLDAAAKTVSNEILREQFDTVMPLLKELYRRLPRMETGPGSTRISAVRCEALSISLLATAIIRSFCSAVGNVASRACRFFWLFTCPGLGVHGGVCCWTIRFSISTITAPSIW